MVNFIIDLIFMKIIINFIFILIDNLTENYNLSTWYNSLDVYQLYLINSIFIFFYYLLTETLLSRSLSKFITKTIVVKNNGEKPNFVDILTRSIIRIFPFEYLSFLKGRKPGWHDEYSNTFVVNKLKFEKSIEEFQELKNLK